MKLFNVVLGSDKSSYNLDMILLYLFVLVVAFIICVISAHKLHIFGAKRLKNDKVKDEYIRSSIEYEQQEQ